LLGFVDLGATWRFNLYRGPLRLADLKHARLAMAAARRPLADLGHRPKAPPCV
jgi:hypothetical protein